VAQHELIIGDKADLRQILEVRDLRVAYARRDGGVWHALSGVSFGVGAGEILAVLGGVGIRASRVIDRNKCKRVVLCSVIPFPKFSKR
jgi:ABC-type uncharacterized transport system ATPase subunit